MTYSFEAGEELNMLRESVRQFAETEIAPIAKELDDTETFSEALTQKMGELGLLVLW